MNNMTKFHFKKSVRLQKCEFTKEEFIAFLQFLQNQKVDNNFELHNEKFHYHTIDFHAYIKQIEQSKSIIVSNINLQNDESRIELRYSTITIFKNNCKIDIYSNDLESFELMEAVIINELKKYKNEVRTLAYKTISFILSFIIFAGLFSEIVGIRGLSEDIQIDSSFFFDLSIVSFIPTFLGLALYQMAVPTFRIKSHTRFSGIKTYLKTDYKSIIKDIILAIIFLIIGKLL
jgi:hypothetical protein